MVAVGDGGCTGVGGGGCAWWWLCVMVAALVCVMVAVRDGRCA